MNNKFNKLIVEIGVFLLVLLIIFTFAYFALYKNNEVFLKKSNKAKEVETKEILAKKEIKNYLINLEKPNDIDGNCFVSVENYGFDESKENILYVQYYVQCYKLGDKKIVSLNGVTVPAKVILKKNKNKYEIKEFINPSESNVDTLFPKKIDKKIKNAKEDGLIKRLKDDVNKQAQDYYGKLPIK